MFNDQTQTLKNFVDTKLEFDETGFKEEIKHRIENLSDVDLDILYDKLEGIQDDNSYYSNLNDFIKDFNRIFVRVGISLKKLIKQMHLQT